MRCLDDPSDLDAGPDSDSDCDPEILNFRICFLISFHNHQTKTSVTGVNACQERDCAPMCDDDVVGDSFRFSPTTVTVSVSSTGSQDISWKLTGSGECIRK